jgi:hypothetical protein
MTTETHVTHRESEDLWIRRYHSAQDSAVRLLRPPSADNSANLHSETFTAVT